MVRRRAPLFGLLVTLLLLGQLPAARDGAGAQGLSRTLLPLATQRSPVDEQSATGQPPEPPTSLTLILQAVAAKTITSEQGLIYRLYAAHGDPRLPAQFAAADPGDDALLTEEASDAWPTLSAAGQAIVGPFFLPPTDPQSWYAQRRPLADPGRSSQAVGCVASPGWSCVEGSLAKVFWDNRYPGDAPLAATILKELETVAWPALTGLMNRQPAKDNAYAPYNGGDDRFDVYLVYGFDRGNPGQTKAYWDKTIGLPYDACKPRAEFMLLDSNFRDTGGFTWGDIVAHEFFHVLQNSYGHKVCSFGEYFWLMESSAVWAESYVYPRPGAQKWNFRSSPYLNSIDRPLNATQNGRAYGTWLLPLHMSRNFGPGIIRLLWEATTQFDSLGALDSVVGGLPKYWARFAADTWNRDPVDYYRQWQGMTLQPKIGVEGSRPTDADLKGASSALHSLPVTKLPYLAARYFDFTFKEAETRSVMFENTFMDNHDASVSIQAFIKIEGRGWSPSPVDLTYERQKKFCRDATLERIEELVIVIANTSFSSVTQDGKHELNPGKDPRLHVTNVGCFRYTGTVKTTFSVNAPDRATVETIEAQVTFQRRTLNDGLERAGGTNFQVEIGSAQWKMVSGSVTVDTRKCTVWTEFSTGSPTITASRSDLKIYNYFASVAEPQTARRYRGTGKHESYLVFVVVCPDMPPGLDGYRCGRGVYTWLMTDESTGEFLNSVSADGSTLQGSYTGRDSVVQSWDNKTYDGQITFQWNLKAERET